mmetsp:Transcript_49253/g.159004  ORF Transcript_49253/g.159004 Transcript_49253/m.159004 type:complete len:225 (-) Transcript_49253:2460-3134(-)
MRDVEGARPIDLLRVKALAALQVLQEALLRVLPPLVCVLVIVLARPQHGHVAVLGAGVAVDVQAMAAELVDDEAVRPEVPGLVAQRAHRQFHARREAQACVLVDQHALHGEVPRLCGVHEPILALLDICREVQVVVRIRAAQLPRDAQAPLAVLIPKQALRRQLPLLIQSVCTYISDLQCAKSCANRLEIALKVHHLACLRVLDQVQVFFLRRRGHKRLQLLGS